MNRFSLGARIRSFTYALRGLGFMLRTQHNAWIHLAMSVAVIGTASALDLSSSDWCWLILAMVGVWAAEAFNTSIEELADALHPEPNKRIAHAKDVAAGAVLILAIGASAIGLIILGPPLLNFLRASL